MYFPPKIQSAMARSASAARISSRREGRPIFSSSLAAQAGTSARVLMWGGKKKKARIGKAGTSEKENGGEAKTICFRVISPFDFFLINPGARRFGPQAVIKKKLAPHPAANVTHIR